MTLEDLTEDRIREMYWAREMSLSDIAEAADCSHGAVHYRMKKWDIPTRSVKESAATNRFQRKISEVRRGKALSEAHRDAISRGVAEAYDDGRGHYERTPEIRKALRQARIDQIRQASRKGAQLKPNYNPDACEIIDRYGKEHGYDFQHAENGGEHYIEELGYWVDGYDRDRNTVIEYYEPSHRSQSDKDERRKSEIMEHMECTFIEIIEWTDEIRVSA